MSGLEKEIQNRSAVIAIVGLGYVGLPLAVSFASAGFRVIGLDNQQSKVEDINQGKSYISDISSQNLQKVIKQNKLLATTDRDQLKQANVIVICVPTPLTRTKDPDISFVVQATEEIAKCLQKEQLIILESTTYPGTTNEVVRPILERTGLSAGNDFYLVFSPERVDPGSQKFNIKNTSKVVGGINERSTMLAELLYGQIADRIVPVSSPEVAEMTKVFENVFRNVNIALVNELAQLCSYMGVSVWEVINAASSKPFGYMPFYPGPGVGGHCIPIDPYYLEYKAKEYDFHTRFIQLAASVNERMPYYVAARIVDMLNEHGLSIKNARIIMLGVTYKKDIEDVRESASIKLIEILNKKGAIISFNDPYVENIRVGTSVFASIELNKENLSQYDCAVIATDHSCYNIEHIIQWSRLVYDTRGVTRPFHDDNIVRLGE